MFNQEENNYNTINSTSDGTLSSTRTFISGVFTWMFLALTVTAITAYLFASNPQLMSLLISESGKGMSTLGYIVMFAPLGFVLAMGMGFARFSSALITLLFAIFAVLMGMSLSFIFLAYTLGSIYITFAVAAGMFGIMAVTGYTTKTDLTNFGSLMMMGLIGIIIASIVNWFVGSSMMGYIISIIGVLVFTGLTAYDVQKLKRMGEGAVYGAESTKKLMIMGALTLYLDFINLFLFLLRLMGNRK
ncbi:MAG: Bax inhibitor-1/YccA family protein [Bacteroidetes bacterium]|nr:Bax inhibitor-1/YccA family protein [Bacteroidota bacterium]